MSTNHAGRSLGPSMVLGALGGLIAGLMLGWLTGDLGLVALGIMLGTGIGLTAGLLLDGRDD